MNGPFTVESATSDDRLDALRVLDAAMLETDAAVVVDRIEANDVFVARFERTGAVVGTLVATRPESGNKLEGTLHVDALAVRRARRGRGIGSALVARAVDRANADPGVDRVTAAFDASLTDFYMSLGFEVEADSDDEDRSNDRFRGVFPVGVGGDGGDGTDTR